MIRETKVGLVVASSFLSLAGGVLGLRMHQGEAVLAPEAVKVSPPPAVVPRESVSPPPSVVAAPDKSLAPPPAAAVVSVPPVEPPPANIAINPPPAPIVATEPPKPAALVETPPPAPVSSPPGNEPVPLPKVNPLDDPKPIVPVPVPTGVPIPTPTPAPVPVPVPVPVPLNQDSPADGPKPIDAPKVEEKPKPPEPSAFQFPPAEPPKPTDTPSAPTDARPIDAAPINAGPVPAPVPVPVPVPTPAPDFKPATEQPKVEPPKSTTPEPSPLGTARLTNDPVPPAPLPESVQPAAVKPTPTPKPQLASDSFLEEEYRIRAGDSFELLSRRFYYSEKYGEALRQYNRDYPIASANLRQDPPRLTPGTVVWIPPMRVLERRYAALLPDVKPVTPAQASNPAPTGNGPTWTPSNPRPNSSATKTYRVKEGGETLAEIARKTLGRSEYWGEIFQRNPQLTQNATTPIAPGTLLTLPGEAKID